MPTLSRLTPSTTNLLLPGPGGGSPTPQDSKRNVALLIKNLILNSLTLDLHTQGTLNTVQGRGGCLKAQGRRTARREPRQTGPKPSRYTPGAQGRATLPYQLRPHVLLEERAPASFWNDGKHTCRVDNYGLFPCFGASQIGV